MRKISLSLHLIFVTVLFCISRQQSKAQVNAQNFNKEILKFNPVKAADVSDERFNYAKRILEETRSDAKGNPENLNVADFWNITTALIVLKEQKELIGVAFKKAVDTDAPAVCSYIEALGCAAISKAIPELFYPFYANCLQNKKTDPKFDSKKYAEDNHLNVKLSSILNTIVINDEKYRSSDPVDWGLQRPLDLKNQQLIDSLFSIYKTYIGKTLAGPKLENTMWLVIQHSDIGIMERYLPVIKKALDEKQISLAPFKMLIDRIYSIKYHYQLFGTQGSGVSVADEKTKNEVMKHLNIE